MAKQKCISLFDDQLEVVSFLDDEQLGRVVRAAMKFMRDGTDACFDGCEGMFYRVLLAQFVRQQVDQKNGLAGANARIEKANREAEKANRETHREESRKNREEIRGVQEELNQIQPSLEIKETTAHPYSPAKPSRLSGEDFEIFWKAYPRKESKAQARKSFAKVTVPLETLLQALETQKQSDQWRRDGGQYIPYASTWLSQRRWEDEAPTRSKEAEEPADDWQQDHPDWADQSTWILDADGICKPPSACKGVRI